MRPGLVERPRIMERLQGNTEAPAVLVSAAAGYGKSTALAQWRAIDPRPFGWVSLQPGGDDAAEVFRAIVAAIDDVVGVPPDLLATVSVPQPPLGRQVIPGIAAALADGPGFVLVLDDYHRVQSAATHEGVAALVEWLPDRCQLALAARSDPLLPIGRWRAGGHLVEIGAADLAFEPVEAAALLGTAGVDLTEEDIRILVERTEGWAVGLSLAAPLLRASGEPSRVVRRFAGDHRHVVEYLVGEVFAGLPRPMRDFMVRTSVLHRLCGSLCDALLGGNGGHEMLERLERANLFLIPLGGDPEWYRYHHLFGDLLLAELRRTMPELEPELHRRAATWFSEHGDLEEAVHHAIAAKDWEAAVTLAARAWTEMFAAGRIDPFLAWLEQIPEPALTAYPPLTVCASHAAALSGQWERSLHLLALAERSGWAGTAALGSTTLASAIASLRARLGPDGVSGMRRDAERVLALEPEDSPMRAIGYTQRALTLIFSDRDAEALEDLRRAISLFGDTAPNPSFAALAVSGLLAQRLGDPAGAERATELARRRADELGLTEATATVLIAMSRAHVLAESHRLEEALIEAEDAVRLLRGSAFWVEILVRAVVAPVLARAGRNERAERLLAEASELASRWPDPGNLPEWIAESRARVEAASHEVLEKALHPREREILELLPTALTMREIGQSLYLSVHTVRTYVYSLFRKLGVTSRAEAVERARAAGLLEPDSAHHTAA